MSNCFVFLIQYDYVLFGQIKTLGMIVVFAVGLNKTKELAI